MIDTLGESIQPSKTMYKVLIKKQIENPSYRLEQWLERINEQQNYTYTRAYYPQVASEI